MFKLFSNLFPKPKIDNKNVEKTQNKLVRRYSRGNVRLQLGQFTTEEEAKKRKKEILKKVF